MNQTTQTIQLRPNLAIDAQQLTELCQQWKIEQLELFGSALRDDFNENSDIDLLVTWQKHHGWSLFDLVTMQNDFTKLFDRPVDLVSRKSIETSTNPLRKAAILNTAQPFYPNP